MAAETGTTLTGTSETPDYLRGGHTTPATPNPRTVSVMTFVLEHELSNHPDKAFVKQLINVVC